MLNLSGQSLRTAYFFFFSMERTNMSFKRIPNACNNSKSYRWRHFSQYIFFLLRMTIGLLFWLSPAPSSQIHAGKYDWKGFVSHGKLWDYCIVRLAEIAFVWNIWLSTDNKYQMIDFISLFFSWFHHTARKLLTILWTCVTLVIWFTTHRKMTFCFLQPISYFNLIFLLWFFLCFDHHRFTSPSHPFAS